ncbi:nucleotidyltransferase domain-containing protein [Hydrogenovibrio sp. JE_KL2]|uniref:nucleotidyltransferase domain-containing protein n=1 Tax=Hydrogenovibrio sp. JE_KL2 TaxID=2651188 RepID=UPI00128DD71F|nr:nucleotidyltransferase domain-containing protein [Hydrogenovibrio sp. JE_KL2]MPQ76823.1 hypothetical protein [Hydrogenovibrio sp. JE_KL2]
MDFLQFTKPFEIIHAHNNFTIEKLSEIRDALAVALNSSAYKDNFTIVTTGSYGRGEASQESDIDLIILVNDENIVEDNSIIQSELKQIADIISTLVPAPTGSTGTFGTDEIHSYDELTKNIGGNKDTNITMTHRVLLLLEGTWLFNENGFKELRANLLSKYIADEQPAGQITSFLLNDIIRFYRTMTTDFANKVFERGQSWGLRSVKLSYSRKLLYFGGIIAVAEAVNHEKRSEKIAAISDLLDVSPLERICRINNSNEHTKEVFEAYEYFLKIISDAEKRKQLSELKKIDRNESPAYLEIRETRKEFSQKLSSWLCNHYQDDHPIHNALLF